VAPGRFDPTSGVSPAPGGTFVLANGAACGGYAVVNTPTSRLHRGYSELGGKSVVGRPISRGWTTSAGTFQAFDTVLLGSDREAARPAHVFRDLIVTSPGILARHQIPMPTGGVLPDAGAAETLLTDPAIRRFYLGTDSAAATPAELAAATARFGLPLTPPAEVQPGLVRQTFSAVVLEHRAATSAARLAVVGPVFKEASLVPPDARPRQASPWGTGPRADEPAGIGWLLVALVAVLAIWLTVLALGLRRVRSSRVAVPSAPPTPSPTPERELDALAAV
jgi:hypothetical protein